MTFGQAIPYITNALEGIYEARESANIAELVAERLTGWKRVDRIMYAGQAMSGEQEAKIKVAVAQLQLHMPVQYVLEEAWFAGMPLYVDKNVLIPRPETEELVEWVVADCRDRQAPVLLDMGTGSGCIAIALKQAIPGATVYAADISPEALSVARRNAAVHHASIAFVQANMLDEASYLRLPMVDILVSNPPYIPAGEQAGMCKNVTAFEPHLALFVPDDHPLRYYEAIGGLASRNLNPGGSMYLEIHEALADATCALYAELGFSDISLKKDMQGKNRMLRVQR